MTEYLGEHRFAIQSTAHPIVASFEPGEAWRYCYVDEVLIKVTGQEIPVE